MLCLYSDEQVTYSRSKRRDVKTIQEIVYHHKAKWLQVKIANKTQIKRERETDNENLERKHSVTDLEEEEDEGQTRKKRKMKGFKKNVVNLLLNLILNNR